jgi:putative folate metabolism gamma-glutamate ligase
MKVTPVKTHKITEKDKNIFKILDKYILKLSEKSIVAVTSKIISITEGRIIKMSSVNKDELIKKESTFYLPRKDNPYHVSLAIAQNTLVATAGIDESNGNGYYVLWPKDPQKTANKIREYLKRRFNLKHTGVIITDSKTTPLRWGVTGIAIAYSGLKPLKNYIGRTDIFGKKIKYTKMSIMDNLAAAATVVMGEGDEQTPIAVIEDVSFVVFEKHNPTEKEIKETKIPIKEDLYAPLLKSVKWRRGDQRGKIG